jgi:hypothetical protein
MVGALGVNPLFIPPIKTIIISSTQGKLKEFTKAFLREKYCDEKLSIAEIAALTFSAKGSILKAMRFHGIDSRKSGINNAHRVGFGIPFGKQLVKRRLVIQKREQQAIEKMKELRRQGFTYQSIADAFNTLGISTKTGRAKWSAKTIHQVMAGTKN